MRSSSSAVPTPMTEQQRAATRSDREAEIAGRHRSARLRPDAECGRHLPVPVPAQSLPQRRTQLGSTTSVQQLDPPRVVLPAFLDDGHAAAPPAGAGRRPALQSKPSCRLLVRGVPDLLLQRRQAAGAAPPARSAGSASQAAWLAPKTLTPQLTPSARDMRRHLVQADGVAGQRAGDGAFARRRRASPGRSRRRG